jgi:phosphatidylglycerophosphate synthase
VVAAVLVVARAVGSLLDFFIFCVMFVVHQFWCTTIFNAFQNVCRAVALAHGKGFAVRPDKWRTTKVCCRAIFCRTAFAVHFLEKSTTKPLSFIFVFYRVCGTRQIHCFP